MCSTSDMKQFIRPIMLRDDEQYKSCSFVETTDFVFVEDQSLKDDEHEILLSETAGRLSFTSRLLRISKIITMKSLMTSIVADLLGCKPIL